MSVKIQGSSGNIADIDVSGNLKVIGNLPSGAATDAKQDITNAKLTSIDSKTIKSDTDNTNIVSSVLPTGAATESTLLAINSKTPTLVSGRQPVDGSGVVQPISATSLPLPTNSAKESGGNLDSLVAKDFATQTTLAAIKAKTDNLDVLLSSRTKPADLQNVTGSISISNFPSTQNVNVTSSIEVEVKNDVGSPIPVSGTVTSNIGTTNGLALDASIATLNTSVSGLLKPASTLTKVTTVDTITNPVAVTGTFFQTTQPISGTVTANAGSGSFTVAQATAANLNATVTGAVAATQSGTWNINNISGTVSLPTGAATEASLSSLNSSTGTVVPGTSATKSQLTGIIYNTSIPTPTNGQQLASQSDRNGNLKTSDTSQALVVTTTAATGVSTTLTIPAAGVGLFHYIDSIEVTAYSTVARTGSATPIVVTTTNLSSLNYTFGTAAAIGTTDKQLNIYPKGIKSNTANTATTIVGPATTGIIWRITATYRIEV